MNSSQTSEASKPSKAFKALKKVLIITYYWPPGSGAGVQRWLKFAKYLPQYGWEPVILTVDPAFAAYPATDSSLENDITENIKVYRTRATDYFTVYKKGKSTMPSAGFATGNENSLKSRIMRFIRGNFFIPDPRIGWNRHAFRKACEIIESVNIRQIITTSPPHSTQLIGYSLKKKYPSLKWIADLRDPWTDIFYYKMFYHTFPARKADIYYERKVLRSADKIITVGKSLREMFLRKLPEISSKVEVITNGFDEDDFKGLIPVKPAKFTISYIGTLSDAYPVNGLTEALATLKLVGADFILKFIGSVSPAQREILNAKSFHVEFLPYVEHGKAIDYMMASSLLLLIIPDHHSNKSILTGKIFEYLATGNPVLCIGPPDGDAAEILKVSGHGMCADYNDTAGIKKIIDHYMEHPDFMQAPEEFSRRALTEKLSMLLSSV